MNKKELLIEKIKDDYETEKRLEVQAKEIEDEYRDKF